MPNVKERRKRLFDKGNSEEYIFHEHFMVNTYFLILDHIQSDLEKRKIGLY